jgi:hypothetical protein
MRPVDQRFPLGPSSLPSAAAKKSISRACWPTFACSSFRLGPSCFGELPEENTSVAPSSSFPVRAREIKETRRARGGTHVRSVSQHATDCQVGLFWQAELLSSSYFLIKMVERRSVCPCPRGQKLLRAQAPAAGPLSLATPKESVRTGSSSQALAVHRSYSTSVHIHDAGIACFQGSQRIIYGDDGSIIFGSCIPTYCHQDVEHDVSISPSNICTEISARKQLREVV